MPRCSKCHTEKPLDAFTKNRSRATGHNPACKDCDAPSLYKAQFALTGPSMEPKRCSSCRLTQPAEQFAVMPRNKDGRHTWCMSCARTKGSQRYYRTSGRTHRDQLHIRFWRNVDCTGGADACWPWEGRIDEQGYGVSKNSGTRGKKAHRLAWELTYGNIPHGMSILHACDNRACVNVFAHLRLGTQADNMRDAADRKRWPATRPNHNPPQIPVEKQTFRRQPGKKHWEQRFWDKVDRSGGDGACWLWIAGTCDGYGMFSTPENRDRAHRIAYCLHYGSIPDGLIVCHTCDQRLCVNYRHLFLGTREDNRTDMIRKNRHAHTLTEENVHYILSQKGIAPSHALATQFHVTRSAISQIWNGRTWKHLSKYD